VKIKQIAKIIAARPLRSNSLRTVYFAQADFCQWVFNQIIELFEIVIMMLGMQANPCIS